MPVRAATADFAGTARGGQPTVAPPVPGRQSGGRGERRRDNALPDSPEQRAPDAALAGADPLVGISWIYGYDPENALT